MRDITGRDGRFQATQVLETIPRVISLPSVLIAFFLSHQKRPDKMASQVPSTMGLPELANREDLHYKANKDSRPSLLHASHF